MILSLLDANQELTLLSLGAFVLSLYIFLLGTFICSSGTIYWFFCRWGAGRSFTVPSSGLKKNQIQKEIVCSLWNLLIFSCLVGITLIAWRHQLFPKLYLHPLEHGLGYLLFSLAILLIYQDINYFLVHRILHHKLLYRFHRKHHESIHTTPFTAFQFHPVEACLHFLRIPIFIWLIPCCAQVLAFGEMVAFLVNIYGHLQGEPRLPRAIKFLQLNVPIFTTNVYHSLHHLKKFNNYGFYTQYWDRLFGSLDPNTSVYYKSLEQNALAQDQ